MGKNLTWYFIQSIFQRQNLVKSFPFTEFNRLKHTVGGYETTPTNQQYNDYEEVKTYRQFLKSSTLSKNQVIQGLMKTLNFTRETATQAINTWEVFKPLSGETIIQNYNLLRCANVNKSTLQDNIYALADETPNLQKKINILNHIELEINKAVAFLQFPLKKLIGFEFRTIEDRIKLPSYRNRIIYLSERLDHDMYDLCSAWYRSSYMITLPIDKIITITDLLLEIGMQKKHIVQDWVIYRYSISTIKDKIQRAKDARILPIKPWVVRASEAKFEKIAARSELQANYPKSSVELAEYISKELDCNIELAIALINRDPRIKTTNIRNLSKMIATAKNYGYTFTDIYRSPTILHTKAETFERRYNTWMQHNLGKPPLFILVSSDNILKRRLDFELNHKQQLNL